MDLEIGQTVIHPHHGTTTVKAIEDREVGGEKRRYVVLARPEDDLVLRVPIESLEGAGIRETIGEAGAEEVLEVLADDPVDLSTSWHKRRSRNEGRMQSGELTEVAAIVRDLIAYSKDRDLPPTDKRMLEDARERLVTELAIVLEREESDIEELIDESLSDSTAS